MPESADRSDLFELILDDQDDLWSDVDWESLPTTQADTVSAQVSYAEEVARITNEGFGFEGPVLPSQEEEESSSWHDVLRSPERSARSPQEGRSLLEGVRSVEMNRQRLNQLNHRTRHRRFRAAIQDQWWNDVDPSPEQLARDIMRSQRELERQRKGEVEDAEVERNEKLKNAANFECNVCFDMAEEPVVTSCGHLFCWSCLYQWLHIHSAYKECPVCKGEVVEDKLTPIYGRGGSVVEKIGSKEDIQIPRRPGGNRVESQRPIPRTLTVRDVVHATHLAQTTTTSIRRDEDIPGSEASPMERMMNTQNRGSRLLFRAANDLWRHSGVRIPRRLTDMTWNHGTSTTQNSRVAAVAAEHDTSASRRLTDSINQNATLTNSYNPPLHETPVVTTPPPSALSRDHSSASSTIAVIQTGIPSFGASEEPNNAGSSRPRRRRSGTSDVDEGFGNDLNDASHEPNNPGAPRLRRGRRGSVNVDEGLSMASSDASQELNSARSSRSHRRIRNGSSDSDEGILRACRRRN